MQRGMLQIIDSDATQKENSIKPRQPDVSTDLTCKTDMPNSAKEVTEPQIPRITVNLCWGRSISIIKPLILLRVAMFWAYGAGTFMLIFFTVLYKQRGVTLEELSVLTIIAPIAEIIGATLSGLAADKLGGAKPVLMTNLLLVMTICVCVLLVPKLDQPDCGPKFVNASCLSVEFTKLVSGASCSSEGHSFEKNPLHFVCAKNFSISCNGDSLDCQLRGEGNFSYELFGMWSQQNRTERECLYQIKPKTVLSGNISCCNETDYVDCMVSCDIEPVQKCLERDSFGDNLMIVYAILFVLYQTFFYSTVRCLEVVAMSLIKEYGSDFGREQFVGMMGILIVSPFAGLLASATTPEGGENNYAATFYLFLAMIFVLLFIVYHLPTRGNSPGERLGKKSLTLLKNVDYLIFLLLIFILGTAWNSARYLTYWFLADLNASSVLFGLITSVIALYGLPVLPESKWLVQKLGTNQVFIIALLAYVVSSVGYSFLTNPWYSLILEAHGALSYHLLWVAVIVHSNAVAPEGLTSTVIAFAGAVHFSAGRSSSGLIGGMIMSKYGAKVAYRLNAGIWLTTAVLYSAYLVVKKRYLTPNTKDESNAENKVRVFTPPEKD